MALIDFLQAGRLEAGCDEAGRGSLAGPVFAAAVVLPPTGFHHPLLNDSKQMTAKDRAIVREYIQQNALSWAVAWLSAQEIDQLNILRASIEGMHRSLRALGQDQFPASAPMDASGVLRAGACLVPESILVDGNRFYPYYTAEHQIISHQCFVKGDGRFTAIAAASVLAKTFRDDYMEALAPAYPAYGWADNKGYPTAEHRRLLKELGPSPYHRLSYHLHEEATGKLF